MGINTQGWNYSASVPSVSPESMRQSAHVFSWTVEPELNHYGMGQVQLQNDLICVEAGLRGSAPGFFMPFVAQASTSAFSSAFRGASVEVCSAVSALWWQALATLAKAAMTIIAMITVPPKKAMFGWRFTSGRPKSQRTLSAQLTPWGRSDSKATWQSAGLSHCPYGLQGFLPHLSGHLGGHQHGD